tara:strand:- start:434 stop:577 length:144 start_codon:yes stop_codon:yes gene_type:complete
MEEKRFYLLGKEIAIGFVNMKLVLPHLSTIKVKTKNNDIIRGKWQKN